MSYQIDENGKRTYPKQICAYKPCGREFTPEREWQKYHSKRCANAARGEKYRERHQPLGEIKVEDVRCKQRHKGVRIKRNDQQETH